MSKPIACHIYDYFEIACMHQLTLLVSLKNGETIIGNAQNVKIIKHDDDAFEVLELKTNNRVEEVALHEIHKIKAQDKNPHFDEVVVG